MTNQEFTPEELQSEEWRYIPDPHFDLYEASSLGRIRRRFCSRGRLALHIMTPALKKGYLCVGLSNNKILRTPVVHKLVALAFVGPRPIGKQVNHIDRIKINNRATNLEYLTPRDNSRHSLVNYARGLQHHNGKLDPAVIPIIRHMHANGQSQRKIAKHYNLSQATIFRAIHYR